ncbi:Carbamoyl-phosphate synthase large chain, partial [Dissostichus eleginoides]
REGSTGLTLRYGGVWRDSPSDWQSADSRRINGGSVEAEEISGNEDHLRARLRSEGVGRWSCVVSLRLQRAAAAPFSDLLHLLFLTWTVRSAAGLAAFDPAEQDFHRDPDSFTCSHIFPKTQPYSNNSLNVVAEIPTGAEISLPLSLLAVNIWFPAMI